MIGRIEHLCTHMSDEGFRRLAAEYGVAEALLRIIDAVRTGTPPAELAADLDAVDDAFARHGTSGVTSGTREYRELPAIPGLPGPVAGHPELVARVCPAPRRCPRLVLGADAPAECAITGLPLFEIVVTG